MSTYLLTWNPNAYSWDGLAKKDEGSNFPSLAREIAEIQRCGAAADRWSCGNTKYGLNGSRFFLLRQVVEPKGIVGSGRIVSDKFEAPHWADPSKSSNYVNVEFDALMDANVDNAMPVSDIADVHWGTQASGISITEDAANEIEHRWVQFLARTGASDFRPAEEVKPNSVHLEGAQRQIVVNAYERNGTARRKCIAHYGAACSICGFDFASMYGELGQGYIHVHHLIPLSEIGEEYEVDPILDLIPVCPNCHAILHGTEPPIKPEVLRTLIEKQHHIKRN